MVFWQRDVEGLAAHIIEYLQQPTRQTTMRNGAIARAAEFAADPVMAGFSEALGIAEFLPKRLPERSVA